MDVHTLNDSPRRSDVKNYLPHVYQRPRPRSSSSRGSSEQRRQHNNRHTEHLTGRHQDTRRRMLVPRVGGRWTWRHRLPSDAFLSRLVLRLPEERSESKQAHFVTTLYSCRASGARRRCWRRGAMNSWEFAKKKCLSLIHLHRSFRIVASIINEKHLYVV